MTIFLPLATGLVLAVSGISSGPPEEATAVPGESVIDAPTWHRDIRPLVARRCGACHRVDGAGPFPLVSREDVASRGRFILELVEAGRMPPWLPDGPGWRDARRLEPAERARLAAWVEAGAPEGEPVLVPPSPSPSPSPGPEPHGPRLRRSLSGTFEIPAESDPAWHRGVIDQRGTTIPLGNTETWRVRELAIETGAPQAVRLGSFAFDDTGAGRYLDERDPRVGFLMSADAGLVPSGAHGIVLSGQDRLRWPDGFHLPVPPGSDAVVEWHYRPTGRAEVVEPRLDFELLPEAEVSRPIHWIPVGVGRVDVAAESVVAVRTEPVELPFDAMLVGVTPRALEIATRIELLQIPPGGVPEEARPVLEIPAWDHHQRETWIAEPVRRYPAGTRFLARFRLDNRSVNPGNPDAPAVDVRRGRRTGVLAMLLHLAAVEPGDEAALSELGLDLVRGMRGRGGIVEP